MPNLYKITTESSNTSPNFTDGELVSVKYHNIFDFPLTISEMIKWRAAENLAYKEDGEILNRNGYYYLEGKEGIIYKRTLRKRISERKMIAAKKASKILAKIPSIKMVGITGSLAMGNSAEDSDIDLMLITKAGNLWTTRLITHFVMKALGFKVRKAGDNDQKDKLCLNIWMDESELVWTKNRNIFTAHEIAQIVPLVNKDKTYEKFIYLNKWVLKYWPNSVKVKKQKIDNKIFKAGTLETILFKLQHAHMRKKITRETVTKTRALFHPQDWSKAVLSRFSA